MACIQSKNSINTVKIIFDENKDEHRNQHEFLLREKIPFCLNSDTDFE